MIEIALRFGWIAQTIVVVAAVILVFYKSFYEDWNKKSEKHKKIIPLYFLSLIMLIFLYLFRLLGDSNEQATIN